MSYAQVTHAKWWGAPGPLFCGPKTQYPHTGYWDYSFECNNQWANPPSYCDQYEGQKGGKHIDDAPYANAAGRTDVEGCCWWGRGGRLYMSFDLFTIFFVQRIECISQVNVYPSHSNFRRL